MRNDLKEIKNKDTILREQLHEILDNLLAYEIPEKSTSTIKPKIKNIEETIDFLINTQSSFARFGDGELSLINNKSIPFQDADPILAARLKQTLHADEKGLAIGINYHYYSGLGNLLPVVKDFYRCSVPRFRAILNPHINFEKQYYSATTTQAYLFFENYEFDKHFAEIKRLWKERNITIICGATVFEKIENNIFNCAKRINYLHAPSKNAFTSYYDILREASNIDKGDLIAIILGPTAKPLVYDLHKLGYQALDMGHIAKDYDAYIKGYARNKKFITAFFSPD